VISQPEEQDGCVRSAAIAWQSREMDVCNSSTSSERHLDKLHHIERSAEMQASIYVADDEPALLNAIVKRLSQAQHKVLGFKSGDDLLAAVEQEVPDLILLDIKMPGRTGLETLEAIRKKTRDARVIILTAYGTVEEAVGAMKLGAYDFLIKTVNLALVEPVVDRALEHRKWR
jgi:DNA-binding NtrC family response regulator